MELVEKKLTAKAIKKELNSLKEEDVYSLLLFALYKMTDSPNYSVLSELSYVLDKKSLLKFLTYFGGMTITIPTAKELRLLISGLLIYKLVSLENRDFNKVVNLYNKEKEFSTQELKDMYLEINEVLKDYTFESRSKGE